MLHFFGANDPRANVIQCPDAVCVALRDTAESLQVARVTRTVLNRAQAVSVVRKISIGHIGAATNGAQGWTN
ncbi:hypothetical protein IVA87_02995 [Bradyrhizobium sp. 147]|jgi:hypothetical protein|uniref:hypothetical protein n=1 Tax=unclassified Bradyrhizobium TaxID=2631580 RepID=UPI001FF7DADC|nr:MULTISPECIES: hypothetical protein [unclassified Bradyrhizobium]MCK1545986.1 hypothetical protein [Bradyrhizobium sp. 179]MCK1625178.1 hypothetical protein [Bradyrhizobium sp. 160]MCK1678467.1 hypothetical protein [Bradyrhizobium sp. 147]